MLYHILPISDVGTDFSVLTVVKQLSSFKRLSSSINWPVTYSDQVRESLERLSQFLHSHEQRQQQVKFPPHFHSSWLASVSQNIPVMMLWCRERQTRRAGRTRSDLWKDLRILAWGKPEQPGQLPPTWQFQVILSRSGPIIIKGWRCDREGG